MPDDFEICLYYNIHVTDDPVTGLETTATYLENYYGVKYDLDFLRRWVAIGDPMHCIDEIRRFADAGATTITLRLIGHDEAAQFERVTNEVLPSFF